MTPRRASSLERDTDHTEIIGVPWETYIEWFTDTWEPGQHVALIGPTGEGKSTHAVRMLQRRKYVLALDPKGGDETLEMSGFSKITSWPIPSKLRDQIAEGKPCRLIVGGSVRTNTDKDKLIAVMRDALDGVRAEGGWTLYADEYQLLADRRLYGLGTPVEEMLISARSRGTSVVTSFQAPAWVPKAATRQATFCVMWPTRDRNMIKSVAESMGRTWQEVAAAIDELPSFHTLTVPKKVHAPMVITKAPKL